MEQKLIRDQRYYIFKGFGIPLHYISMLIVLLFPVICLFIIALHDIAKCSIILYLIISINIIFLYLEIISLCIIHSILFY